MAQLCKSVDHNYFGTPLSAKEAGSVETKQFCDSESKKSKTKQAQQLEEGEGMLNDDYKAMPSRSESPTSTAGVPEQNQRSQVADDGECAADRGENAADMGEHAVGRGDHTVDGEQAAWCCRDHVCRHKHTSQLSEARNLSPEKLEMKNCISSDLVLNNLDQQTSKVFRLDEHTSLNSLTFSDKQLQMQAGAEQRRDHWQDGVIPHDPCSNNLLIDFSDQQPWMNLNMNISQTSQANLHPHHDSRGEGLGLHEKDMCLEEKLLNSGIESESSKTGSSEFDMIDEEYIDKMIGKLDNPQPDCWLQRSRSCMLQSPSLLDTDVPCYQEMGILSLSHPEDCVLNSENPRLGMTPSTLLPELPQEQVPHLQGMIVPDVISTHKTSTSEHQHFISPVPVHHFSNDINTEVEEDESCPKEFLVSVAEPFWAESATNIPPQRGMQKEIYPNIDEEEKESFFSLVQAGEKPLLSSVEAGEKSSSSAHEEDILANPQSSLCYKSNIKSQEVAELSADREQASARGCRRQNDDRTQKNDVNDMELGVDDKKERHDDEDRTRRINSSSQSGDCGMQISICKKTSDQQLMLNLKEKENIGTRSKPRDDSLLKNDERQPSMEDEVKGSNGSTQSCDRASQTTATQLDWEQFKIHERKSEDYEWSSDDNGSMQSEHDDCSSEDDNNTEPLQESATDAASEDQLSYFFSYDDDEMPTDVRLQTSIVSVRSSSVTEISNMASSNHSCDVENEGRMVDVEDSSGSKTSDEDFDYHLQNSTGLTENSLVQGHKNMARCKPMLKLKLHLKEMSCASENMVDKRTKNGLLLEDQNWSPEEQHKDKDIGSKNAVVSRHTVTDDLQEHSQSSCAGEQNSQKAITRRAEQLIPVKVFLCGQPISSAIPPSQPLPVKTESLKLSPGSTQTLPSSTIVNKTRSPCHGDAEEHSKIKSEKRQEENTGEAHDDERENFSLKGQLNVKEKENKWNVGMSVKGQQEKRNCRGDWDEGDAENMNMDNLFDKVEKEKKLCANGKEIGNINKNNIYDEERFDNEKNMRELGGHQDTENDERDGEEEEQKESRDDQNSDDERDEEKEKKELGDDQNSDGEKEKECLTKARDNQYADDKDSDVQQKEVREDHNGQGEEKENKEDIGDGAEDRTVCVTGLTAGDEELCQLYFENTKRSGGGDIAEQGFVWDDMANQFLITFVDRQAAHRVLERSHIIADRDVQVKHYDPPPCYKDTILVTGIPQGTSADCLQNFLESVADMALDTVQINEAEGKAMVFLADGEADLNHVKHLQQACQKNPLYGRSVLSVQRIPLSYTVLVEDLNPKTKESAILYFFSNKNRNSGGPVTYTKRLNSTSALVHFENHRDAQAVVDKGSHILDEFPLKVSLHLDCFPLTAGVTEEEADDCSSLLTEERVSAIHKEHDFEDQTQGEQHHLASEEIHQHDLDAGPCEITQQDHVAGGGGSSFHHESSPRERHSRGSSEWKNDRHASYRPDRRLEQHQRSHISQPHCQQPAHFEGHTAFNSSGPSATHERSSSYRPTHCKFDRGVKVENTRNLHCPQSQQTECPHVIIKLGSDVVDRFRENKDALRHLATDLSQIHGKFQWKPPDCIYVVATTSDIPEDWCEQVTKRLDRHKHLIEVNLGKGMNPLPDKRESQRPKRLAEGGVDCKEMPKKQMKEQHLDVDLTHTSVTERYRPDMQKRLEKENKEISKELQSIFYEEVISNVKACQIKVMLKPQVSSMFKEKCKSVTLLVDEEKSLVKVRVNTSQHDAKKMKADVMEFMTKISERKIPLSAAMAKMFTNVQAQGHLQAALDRKGVACCLHLEFNSLSVSAHASHYETVESILTSLFKEEIIILDGDKLASTKSSAWQELVDKLQQRDKERLPPPVVMLDVQKNVVRIADVHENIAMIFSAVKTFFSTNKMQEKNEKIDQNHCKFLHEFCAEEMKQLQEQAKERGVSFKFSKDGTVTFKGFHDSLSAIYKEMKDFLKTIQSQQKSFSGPGVAAYLTSTRGQEFLQQTGHANGCLVTMCTGRVHETSESSDNILARCRLEQGAELLIIQGDITKCHVDAIVNAANGDLHHAGGVALAIAKAGGKTIDEDCRKLVSKYGPLSEGEVVVTRAGQLPCSHVLHAVGPMWQDGQKGEAECLHKTIMNIMKMATEKQFSSVAIPSVSCGIFGFPVDRATDIIVRSIVEYSEENGDMCLEKIILIDLNKKSLSGLLSAAKHYLEKSLTVTGEIRETSHMTPQSSKYKEESPRKSSEKAWEDRRSDPSKDKKSRLPFRIISGELTKSQADIIVSTVHPSLDMQKGVLSRSVLEHGGHKIQKELQEISRKHGPTQIGKVVQSSGGDLRCKSMFHLSLPMWRDDKGQVLKSAIKECLESAKKLKAKSIAFPTLGTGKLGYPSDAVASIMHGVIGKWLHDNRDSSVRDVQVVVFFKDRDSLEAFQNLEGSHHHGDGERHGHVAGYRDRDTPANLKMKVGETTIIVKEGNILKERCDAIINSSNNSMDLTRGALSKKLLEACGDEIFAEIIKKRPEMEQEGVAATRVPSDCLDCSYIIHISADRFKQDWRRGVLKVLQLADKMNLRSLALPALGTGGLSGEPQSLAQNMQQAIEMFINRAKSVREIRLVIFQQDMLLHYVNAFKRDTASGHAQDKERMLRGDSSPRSSSEEPLPAWKSVQVLVYSNKIGAAERVLEKIDKHIKQNQTTKQEEDRVICRFSPKQRSAVMDLQEKYEVAIDLDTHQGVIKIAGLETNVLKALAAVKDIKSESNKHQPITASMMAIRWEYEVDKGKFRSFDPEHIMEIEAAYKGKASTVNLTDKQGRKYQINFKDNKEYSLDNKNLRPIAVRRRDVVQEKSREIPLPDHWQHMSKGDKVKLVDLNPSSNEYKRVLQHFGGQAVKIQRVQNPTLFQQYKVKKKELEMHNPPGTENEQRLWHGTDSKNIDSIITNGFNRSYCGQHGTAFGQGVYFATNSGTSRGYASGGKMFQVRVLVGESTQGNSNMRIPPNKSGQNRPYDSLSGPGMFIIFHDSQAYPEYLITYQ